MSILYGTHSGFVGIVGARASNCSRNADVRMHCSECVRVVYAAAHGRAPVCLIVKEANELFVLLFSALAMLRMWEGD